MSVQLALEVETPLTFVVKAWDGRMLDRFTEDDLASSRAAPDKVWSEACAWAYLAWRADDRRSG